MTTQAEVVPTKKVLVPASANRPLRDVRDISNKANPNPVDALVVQKQRQVVAGGGTPIPQQVPTHTPVQPVELTNQPMVGPVPANEVGLHSMMKKDFHAFLSKLQMLSHQDKEKIMEATAWIEKLL
jgi:hypothetical protein